MSELITNKITPGTGSSNTITLGDSGDTFTIPAGVTITNSGTATGFSTDEITKSTSEPTATTNPSGGVGSIWLRTTTGEMYCCTDATTNANVWTNIGDGTGTEPFVPTTATGGTITTDGDYKVHTFTTSGTFNFIVSAAGQPVEYLLVGGGSSGGGHHAGGGGAGGVLTATGLTVTAATYTVTVGAGGTAILASNADGNDGNDSVLSGTGITTLTAGGGGAGSTNSNVGHAGRATNGNGGGGGLTQSGGAGNGSGFAGGDGTSGGSPEYGGGGGGGAGAVGANGTNAVGGDGGVGVQNNITGTNVYYAGGGGGCAYATLSSCGAGGNGGGGAGAPAGATATSGTANTGGGGGGGTSHSSGNSGAGGSGVVILRYKFQ